MAGLIDNIQCSWVKMGLEGARQALRAGCNDLGGTLMNENISRAAGAEHGQGVEEEDLAEVVAPLGRPLEQRTTLYGRVRTVGRRLPASATPVTIGTRGSIGLCPPSPPMAKPAKREGFFEQTPLTLRPLSWGLGGFAPQVTGSATRFQQQS